MTYRYSTKLYYDKFGFLVNGGSTYLNSSDSPKVNGVLQLRANPLRAWKMLRKRVPCLIGSARVMENTNPWYPPITGGIVDQCYSQAYARFRGKVYSGSASLGVTFGSYKQTREMVTNRCGQLNQRLDSAIAKLSKNASLKNLASTHLEVIFGWVPLLSDLHAATQTLCQEAIPPQFIKSRASLAQQVDDSWRNSVNRAVVTRFWRTSVTLSARVDVTNPNLWLAERAGMLNPAAVIWDLVPWSFVVNMFVNTGQLVNAISDFAGLTFREYSQTITAKGYYDAAYWTREQQENILSPDFAFGGEDSASFVMDKERKLQPYPFSPSLVIKVPEANWELAAMAGSLMVQKFSKLNRFFTSKKLEANNARSYRPNGQQRGDYTSR